MTNKERMIHQLKSALHLLQCPNLSEGRPSVQFTIDNTDFDFSIHYMDSEELPRVIDTGAD